MDPDTAYAAALEALAPPAKEARASAAKTHQSRRRRWGGDFAAERAPRRR